MGRFPTQRCRHCGRSFFSACTCAGASFSSDGEPRHLRRLLDRSDRMSPAARSIVRGIVAKARAFLSSYG